MDEIIITNEQKDALQELANIGAAHAATALSQMIQKTIEMGIPQIEVIPLEKTINYVLDEEIAVAVFLKISDTLPTYSLLLLSFDTAKILGNQLLDQSENQQNSKLTEMEESALNEVGNVMMCAFFDSIAELLNITLIPGPPSLACDMPSAILDYLLIQIGEMSNQVFVFETDLTIEQQQNLKINLFLIPEPKSITTILEKLGMK